MTIIEGERFIIKCTGISVPIFNATWYKNYDLITYIPNMNNDTSDRNRISTLTITSASVTDKGLYECVLSNLLGSITSTVIWVNIQCKYELNCIIILMLVTIQ